MTVEVISAPPPAWGDPAKDPILTVRVHPDADPADLTATRVMKIAVAHPGEWPWRRITGLTFVGQHTDLSTWPTQPLGDLALVMGHPLVLTGREVTAG